MITTQRKCRQALVILNLSKYTQPITNIECFLGSAQFHIMYFKVVREEIKSDKRFSNRALEFVLHIITHISFFQSTSHRHKMVIDRIAVRCENTKIENFKNKNNSIIGDLEISTTPYIKTIKTTHRVTKVTVRTFRAIERLLQQNLELGSPDLHYRCCRCNKKPRIFNQTYSGP